jgi:hypothetical protein
LHTENQLPRLSGSTLKVPGGGGVEWWLPTHYKVKLQLQLRLSWAVTIAQRWADQCIFDHDSLRTKKDVTKVGQNAYIGHGSSQSEEEMIQTGMASPVQSCYDEVINPGFDSQGITSYK